MKTTPELVHTRRLYTPAAGLTALWVVLAIARPGVTYHLAPLIVASLPAVAGGFEGRAEPMPVARLAGVGAGLALGTSLLLSSLGRLAGPTLLPFGGAALEAVIFSFLGALAGWILGRILGGAGRL